MWAQTCYPDCYLQWITKISLCASFLTYWECIMPRMHTLQVLIKINKPILVDKNFWPQSPSSLSKAHWIQGKLFHDKDFNKALSTNMKTWSELFLFLKIHSISIDVMSIQRFLLPSVKADWWESHHKYKIFPELLCIKWRKQKTLS